MQLPDIIIGEIKSKGPISFYRFMEMCLYYPALGYYTNAENLIGAKGDYYTGSYLSTALGTSIGRQVEEFWRLLEKKPFTIVEYGAGMGYLTRDIINYLQANSQLYTQLQYVIIERSEIMRKRQQALLPGNINWYNSLMEMAEFTGCVISNEVADNFPVHKVIMQKQLMEVLVGYKNGFIEITAPAKDAVTEYFNGLNVLLPEYYCTEANTDIMAWLHEISTRLTRGFMLTIDYGYPSSTLYNHQHSSGTLTCYRRHQVNFNPYQYIGKQDITAHVNFSALAHWGEINGFNLFEFTDQKSFLKKWGIRELNLKDKNPSVLLKHLLLKEMGEKFFVITLQKGID